LDSIDEGTTYPIFWVKEKPEANVPNVHAISKRDVIEGGIKRVST
jgi:hypothetical protein